MAKAEKKPNKGHANIRPFAKGVSGNPLGGKLHDPEIKAIKKLTKEELKEMGSLVLKNNLDALREIKDDPKASVLKVLVASVCIKAIAKGDMHSLDVLLNRLIGKVKEEIAVEGDGLAAPIVNIVLPNNGRQKK